MKVCRIMWWLDWDSLCCCYWSWWVPGRHKEHRQLWLRPATSRSWKVWRSDPMPCRICWVDEYKCWSWKTNLWWWVWALLFTVFKNIKNYEQTGNCFLVLWFMRALLLYFLMFWGNPMSPSSGVRNMSVELCLHKKISFTRLCRAQNLS